MKHSENWGKFLRVSTPIKNESKLVDFLINNLLKDEETGSEWYADSVGTTDRVVFPG